jgi:hypothetical protein
MPNNLDFIKKIIADSFFDAQQNKLIEDNTDDKGIRFKMEKDIFSETKYLLYRFDPDQIDIFPFFNGARGLGLKKICDYILFTEQNDRLYVLLIELKRSSGAALPQLTASQYFVEYLIKSGKRIGLDLTDDIRYRKIKIKETISGKKQRTQMQAPQPDENGIISYLYTQFRVRMLLEMQ